jgi:hypothetical protein
MTTVPLDLQRPVCLSPVCHLSNSSFFDVLTCVVRTDFDLNFAERAKPVHCDFGNPGWRYGHCPESIQTYHCVGNISLSSAMCIVNTISGTIGAAQHCPSGNCTVCALPPLTPGTYIVSVTYDNRTLYGGLTIVVPRTLSLCCLDCVAVC